MLRPSFSRAFHSLVFMLFLSFLIKAESLRSSHPLSIILRISVFLICLQSYGEVRLRFLKWDYLTNHLRRSLELFCSCQTRGLKKALSSNPRPGRLTMRLVLEGTGR